jgi:fibronectin-binding autotransporter adhesin
MRAAKIFGSDRASKQVLQLAAGAAVLALAFPALATVNVTLDGQLNGNATNEGYTQLGLQTNDTGFGHNGDATGLSSGGSELDGAYAATDAGHLYLFFSGNLQNNFNHLNIFLSDGRTGQNILTASGSLGAMNGSTFSPGFNATYALDINGGGSPTLSEFVNVNNLTQTNGPSSFIGSFNANDANSHGLGYGVAMSVNNTNANNTNTPAGAAAVATGFEISIPLSALDNPRGPISVMADINGGSNGFLSNQFLPGLASGTGNVGGGGTYSVAGAGKQGAFNLSSLAFPASYMVAVQAAPAIASTATSGSWNNNLYWGGANYPQNAGDSANLTSNASAGTASLDSAATVGQVTFNSAAGYAITAGGGTLTLNDTGDGDGNFATLVVNAGSNSIAAPISLANGVTVDVAPSSSLNITGNISGTGTITKNGSGTLKLGGTNSHGDTIVMAGTLELDTSSSAGNGIVYLGDGASDTVPATLLLPAGMTFNNTLVTNRDDSGSDTQRIILATGNASTTGSFYLDGGLLPSAVGGATLSINGVVNNGTDGSSTAKRDVLANSNGNTGTVVLSNANTYTGITAVDAGTLVLGNSAAANGTNIFVGNGGQSFANVNAALLGNTAGENFADAITTNQADTGSGVGTGTRTIGGTNTTGTITYSGSISLNGGAVLTAASGGTVNFTGVISNGTGGGNTSRAVTASGSGTVILSNVETYTGNTTVSGGTLTIPGFDSIASTTTTVASGATLNLTGTLSAGFPALISNGTTNIGPSGSGILTRTFGTITLGSNGIIAVADPAIANHANRNLIITSALNFGGSSSAGWTGKLDLAGNDMIVHVGGLNDINSQVAQGYTQTGGFLTGTAGIVSSTSANDPTALTTLGVARPSGTMFDGQTVSNTDVLVKYTYYGDANLDGHVDGTDYSVIDTNNGMTSGALWSQGDFNYDGKVDGSDYSLIDNTFNQQSVAGLAAEIATNTSEIAGGAAVPEPASVGLLMIGAIALLSRRHRKSPSGRPALD